MSVTKFRKKIPDTAQKYNKLLVDSYWRHCCPNSGDVTDNYAKYFPVCRFGNYARNRFDRALSYLSSEESFGNMGSIVTYKLKKNPVRFFFSISVFH